MSPERKQIQVYSISNEKENFLKRMYKDVSERRFKINSSVKSEKSNRSDHSSKKIKQIV